MYVPIPHVDNETDTLSTINKWYEEFEERADKGARTEQLSKLRDSILELFDEEIRHLGVLRDLCKTGLDSRL